MIRETTIDSSLNRLMRHFARRLILRPPASAATLARLEAHVGLLPRDLVFFLSTCDGFDLHLPGVSATRFCTSQDMLLVLEQAAQPAPPPGLLPLRCDVAGRDWLVLDEPPMHGVVLRWDPGTRGEHLIASTFGSYFEAWSHYLVNTWTPEGTRATRKSPGVFNAAYVQRYDPDLTRLADSHGAGQYFAQLEVLAAAGDDFE